MRTSGVRIMALFLAYGLAGMSGEWAVGLVAGGAEPGERPGRRAVQARAGGLDECAYEAERVVSLPMATLGDAVGDAGALLRVRAGSGELRVEGRAGLDRVRAVGRACASEEEGLDALRLTLEERGGAVELTAHYPARPRSHDGRWTARMDLTVEVPLGMAAELDDSSGGLEVSGTGALRIDDSSGSILVHGIRGPVVIDDSSGEVELRDVEGDVTIDDGSGEIEVRDVRGRVQIDDGSGSIAVVQVTGSVEVGRDGSGSISVRDVGGDFSVLRDGSGSIRHTGVAGRVDIPRKRP